MEGTFHFVSRLGVRICRRGCANLFVAIGSLLCSHSLTAQDAAAIMQRSSEANERDWAAAPQFDSYERNRDKNGDRTYAVTMLFGSPYRRLVAVNGRPLDAKRQKEEEEKYEHAVDERREESPEKKSRRIARYEAERKRDHELLEQLTKAFDFRLLGTQPFDGYRVYVVKASPRRDYKPPDRDSEVLAGMEGTLWIDQETYQWVKVEAHVTHPVRIEGLLAEVEPGTRFELEKRPATSDIWLPSHFSMRSDARIMLLVPRKGQEDDLYFNYRKAGSLEGDRGNDEARQRPAGRDH